jgi:exodeoxyribonuclease VII small subunit
MADKANYQILSTELDTILNALQAPDLDIDAALELYKRGQKVVKELEKYLQTAENSVRKLSTQQAAEE